MGYAHPAFRPAHSRSMQVLLANTCHYTLCTARCRSSHTANCRTPPAPRSWQSCSGEAGAAAAAGDSEVACVLQQPVCTSCAAMFEEAHGTSKRGRMRVQVAEAAEVAPACLGSSGIAARPPAAQVAALRLRPPAPLRLTLFFLLLRSSCGSRREAARAEAGVVVGWQHPACCGSFG